MTAKSAAITAGFVSILTLVNGAAFAASRSRCSAAKAKTAGKKAASKLTCLAKGLSKGLATDSTCLAKAEVKFSSTVAKAESKTYTDDSCLTTNDAAGVESDVDGLVDDVLALANPPAPPGSPCDAAKANAAGKKAAAKLVCHAKAVTKGIGVDVACLAKAEVKFSSAVAKAEAKSGGSDCSHAGDGGAYEALVDATVDDVINRVAAPCSAGTLVGPACWFFGVAGQSCGTVCTNQGLGYDAATTSHAGSGGTDVHCNSVLDRVGAAPGNQGFTAMNCSVPNECILAVSGPNTQRLRCLDTPADPNASSPSHRRACACATTTTTTTTSTTLPCTVVGGLCWYAGDRGGDCDSTCAAHERVYDPATKSYAGSDGTDANCIAVASALGFGTFLGPAASDGYGCFEIGGSTLRDGTPTTSSATFTNIRRACACQ